MKYKGKELKEITTPQIVDPPKEMLVWSDDMVKMNKEPQKETVYAVVKLGTHFVAITSSYQWGYCAEIPEEPKPRRATNRELAKWLAQGKGEQNEEDWVVTAYAYKSYEANVEVSDKIKVRKWDDTDWHEPTVDYMGIDLPLPGPSPDELLDYEMRVVDMPKYLENHHVKIGNQIWMSENLFVHDGGDGIHWNKDNGEWYYTWEAAKRIADKIPGWHLPSREEWNELVEATGNDGANLRDKSWGGTDKYGFGAAPAGNWYDGFRHVGSLANFCTADPYGDYAWNCYIDTDTSVFELNHKQGIGFSVRLVKDR